MMTARVIRRNDSLEISLAFSDSRLVDIEFALLSVLQEKRWDYVRTDVNLDHARYKLESNGVFLASIHITHGLEPPTRVLIANRPPDGGPAATYMRSTASLGEALLKECALRGLATERAVASALAEIEKHANAVA